MKLKIPETITKEEFDKMAFSVKDKQRRLAFMLGFYQAMRVSEVVRLNPSDINKETKMIHIKQAKGSRDRIIPIAPEVFRGLKYLPIEVGIRALQVSLKKYAKETIKKDIHFHTLRHSGATYYLNKKKWDLRSIQRFLGHSKIETTTIYTHVSPDDLRDRMWENE